jgi:hypothetical protein
VSVASVFVGLVTHPRSRFNADGTATRQAQAIVDALVRRHAGAGLLVSDRDDYDPVTMPLDRTELLRSARYQADLEHRWRRYLAAGGGWPAWGALADTVISAVMSVKREAGTGALLPWGDGAAGRAAATRLLNIDLSHLRTLESAVASGSEWVLVLEDDARVDDADAAADDLLAVVETLTPTPVAFASLSESISLDRLGVEAMIGGPVASDGPPWLVRTSRPITNTVCANVYRASFAAELAAGIRARGLTPVAPIDWRLNEQIMRMMAGGRLGPDSCAWAIPGLFRQASMHAAG